jgi:glycosyltransferase involved in cell wall biosynthesis
MSEPLISVVMPVHNGLPFLSESIQSILDQTLTNFEFVILDDGSTDGTDRVLRDYQQKDSRVRICESKHRLGLAASSNFVVANSSASLIARMDADDICEPERLQRQWQVMRDNPRVGVVGTLCDGIDVNGKQVRSRDRSRIRRRSEFPPFPHGSAMLRRALFEEVGGYRRECEGREDQDLFRRMGARSQVVTLPEVLYHYRYHLQNFSVANEARSMSPHSLSSPEGLSSLYSLGAMRLWAGHSPSILRAIINDPSGKWTLQKLIVTTWAVWGSLHPNSLRSISRLVVRTRDLFAGVRVTDGRFYEWRYE